MSYLLLRCKRDWTVSRFQLIYFSYSIIYVNVVVFFIFNLGLVDCVPPSQLSYIVPHKYLGLLVAGTGTVLCGEQLPHTAVAAAGQSDTGVHGYVIRTRKSQQYA